MLNTRSSDNFVAYNEEIAVARYRFPPRAYGPFTETFSLPSGMVGQKSVTHYESYTPDYHYESTSGTDRQFVTTVTRTGIRRKKPVDLAPSAYYYKRNRIENNLTSIDRYTYPSCPNDTLTRTGCVREHRVYSAATNVSLKTLAEVAALAKLKNQKVNLGVAFAERSRTATLVGESALAIANSVINFRRGNLKEAWRVLGQQYRRKDIIKRYGRGVSSQWLALQYGWKPLMSDVYGATEALANRQLVDYACRVASRKTEKSDLVSIYGIGYHRYSERVKRETSYHVALNYTPKESLLSSYNALGLTNPAEIAWELVPFSFVVDWFVPIGSWLGILDATVGWNYTSGTCTRRASVEVDTRDVGNFAYGNKYEGFGNVFQKEFVVDRVLYASSPIPKFPGLKDPRSLGRMANAMALLVSVFSGAKILNYRG